MSVKVFKDKKKNLEIYLKGLKHIQSKVETAIRDSKWDIRKACAHTNLSYAVGYEQAYDYERSHDRFHCEYCDECETLFVIKAFGFLENPKEEWSSQRDIDLSDFMYPFFIDRISKREDK